MIAVKVRLHTSPGCNHVWIEGVKGWGSKGGEPKIKGTEVEENLKKIVHLLLIEWTYFGPRDQINKNKNNMQELTCDQVCVRWMIGGITC